MEPIVENQAAISKRRRGSSLSLFSKFLILFIFLIGIVGFLGALFLDNADRWYAQEQSRIEKVGVSCEGGDQQLQAEIGAQVKRYSESMAEVDFIQLDTSSVCELVADSIRQSLPDGFQLESVSIMPGEGRWFIYLQLSVVPGAGRGNFSLPVTMFDLRKDSFESAELYTTSLVLGGLDLTPISRRLIINQINSGIADAVTTLNSSRFTSRSFENIELTQNGVIVKGKRNIP